MIQVHTPGFPRMGAQRELKHALEAYWRGDSSLDALEHTGRQLRQQHWALQREAGLDWVSVGDFAFYDQVASQLQLFGCEPPRFGFSGQEPELDRHFAMARGTQGPSSGHPAEAHPCASGCAHPDHAAPASAAGQPALAMTKWFDTNYHCLVPEFSPATRFSLASSRLFDEVAEAQALGHRVKVQLLGPLTLLWLGRTAGADLGEQAMSAPTGDVQTGTGPFDRLDLLDQLLPVYAQLLARLQAQGVAWVQLDEPILGLDLPGAWALAFERAYHLLHRAGPQLLLATYFSPLEDHLRLACQLPVAGLHVDAVRAGHELQAILDWLPPHRLLSIGIVDGRNVWRTDLDQALACLRPALARRGELWLAPSCSLLHVPLSLADDPALDPELRSWLAGGLEKLAELQCLRQALVEGEAAVRGPLFAARAATHARRHSPRVRQPAVAARLASLPEDVDRRQRPFAERQPLQQARLGLPDFPTTTIGSFPQTAEIRAARAALRRGTLGEAAYQQAMQAAVADAVQRQEALGLDVLVHGEAERNDMVEYFGEQLDGFAFTHNGWVQSYGSRCVKPPILFGDVSRPRPMTVAWTRYAQGLTRRPMKGMLTGPITLLQWSFVRDDQPRADTALQLALAVRDEVLDLEQAGIPIVQIDEPAFREGLPLRRAQWDAYLAWAARAFRVAASGVDNSTQIHTHMCYSAFNDILPQIAAMDADVITIETSRSAMALLQGFADFRYPNQIGPGVYDIHSPRVPAVDEMLVLLQKAAQVLPPSQLWVNPDCGLKTRGWPETEAALRHMVAAAKRMRVLARGQDTAAAVDQPVAAPA